MCVCTQAGKHTQVAIDGVTNGRHVRENEDHSNHLSIQKEQLFIGGPSLSVGTCAAKVGLKSKALSTAAVEMSHANYAY